MDNQCRKSTHFKLKICISCLHVLVYIFGRIFVKLTQFVHLINSFDFEKNWTISKEKVSILTHDQATNFGLPN